VKILIKISLAVSLFFLSFFVSWQGVSASYGLPATPTLSVLSRIVNSPEAYSFSVSHDSPVTVSQQVTPPNDVTLYTSGYPTSWPLEQIDVLAAPQAMITGEPVLVAVLDTGIDISHEGISEKVVMDKNLTKSSTSDDIYGHGTPITGIIAADTDPATGIAGIAPDCRIMNVKVANDEGKCRLSNLISGIIWATDNGARVINISIELKEATPALQEAINYAWDNGAVVVAAAGNDGGSLPVFPAALDNCIAVTAIRENNSLAPLANYGDWIDVAAPGWEIYALLPDGKYGYKYGTSFAAAYVSGLAALLFPLATDTNGDDRLNDEVYRAIVTGCHDIDVDGTGKGCIDVTDSIAVLMN
jgi:subtilisin family serine protease